MTQEEHNVVRAAWQVMHDMTLDLSFAELFRQRLETQIENWRTDEDLELPGMIA